MIRIIRGRATGKTTELLEFAAAHGCDILTATAPMADYILMLAEERGLPGPVNRRKAPGKPLSIGGIRIFTVHDILSCRDGRSRFFLRPILVDELDAVLSMLLPGMQIAGYSVTVRDEEVGS